MRLTLSVSGVPAVPAVNVIWFVPWPDVIVPFVIDQAYVAPRIEATLATRFGDPAPTSDGAFMTSGGGGGQVGVTVRAKSCVNGHPFASDPLTVTVPEKAAVGVPPIVTVDPTT